MNIQKLNCNICGFECGEIVFDGKFIEQNFADIRCDNCNKNHSTFKELERAYMNKTGKGEAEAEEFVKKNRKKADFEESLKNVTI